VGFLGILRVYQTTRMGDNMKLFKNKHYQAKAYAYHSDYNLVKDYIYPDNFTEWLSCPVCGLKPKIWTYDNGRSTGCGCHNIRYDHFSIFAESIMSHVSRNKGSAAEYDSDALQKNWNTWVNTGRIMCDMEKLKKKGRW